MDVELMPQELPVLANGLRSLATCALDRQRSLTVGFLDAYFSNKEAKNILKLASQNEPNCGWQHGWVPFSTIAGFKAVKAAKVSVEMLREVAAEVVKGAFEISADGLLLRRVVSFDQQSLTESLTAANSLTDSCCIFKGLTADAIQPDFIAFIKEKFGGISRFHFDRDQSDADLQICLIQFQDASVMIKLLASNSSPATYEDSILSVEAGSFPSPTTSSTNTLVFDFNHPSLTSRDPRQQAVKQIGHTPIHASAVLGYPVNRILRFGPVPDTTQSAGFTASSIQFLARTEFEKLAPVVECILKPGETYGFIRFKKSVAKEIAEMVMRHRGIELGVGEKVVVEALQGEAERFFHSVKAEKDKIAAVASDAVIALNASKVVKQKRQLALKPVVKRKAIASVKKRQSSRIAAAKEDMSVVVKVDGVSNKGKKRMMMDEDTDVTDGGEGIVILGRRTKKTRVDDLEDLVKGMNFSSKAFWDTRFETEEHFEWLAAADILADHVASSLSQSSHQSTGVLHVGCGTSTVSNSLRHKLVPDYIKDSKSIINLDYSELAVLRGKDLELKEFENVAMRWIVADLLSWDSLKQSLEQVSDSLLYRIIVEKSTADAISCGVDVATINPVSHQPVTVSPTVALAFHLSKVTALGSIWIALSYSKYRFDFLNPESDEYSNDAAQLWKVVNTISVKPETTKSSPQTPKGHVVHEPEVFHTLFFVQRI
ncbi:UNVERIFIED_CONTAM: hypothetical protein HDU68_010751 [Siphonaria sp. JEL0065]|nr:hypothetical protein HDU68_010751 [Siphonaria sp. JEL0065]